MTYVIGEACVDVLDRACVEECPVDCIYEGERYVYSTTRRSARTAGRGASRCARWRRSITRMTCRRNGRATPQSCPRFFANRCRVRRAARLSRGAAAEPERPAPPICASRCRKLPFANPATPSRGRYGTEGERT